MALCQDVDDERAFWCERADMATESIDKRMCPDKIAVCLCKVFVLSAESKLWTFLMTGSLVTKRHLNLITE
jgi:hypothetical protein